MSTTYYQTREIETYISRLEKIWLPMSHTFIRSTHEDCLFDLWAMPKDYLYCQIVDNTLGRRFLFRQGEMGLMCRRDTIDSPASASYRFPKEQADFEGECLELFRRNCWLSGANIEATAHEKMEWMRGFSQQEIDEWNLCF